MSSNSVNPKKPQKYSCKSCDFYTCNKKDFMRHLETIKHINNVSMGDSTDNSPKNPNVCQSISNQCSCGKIYKDKSGLWRHKKKGCFVKDCSDETSSNNINNNNYNNIDLKLLTDLFKLQMNENQELKGLMREQYKENQKLQQQIIEMAKEKIKTTATTTTTNTNCNNNNTNNFNLQFFLNEQCKDALNIMEFISQLQVKLSDLDMVGRVGYSEGISKIFIRGLKELDVFKRPIHCSDLKREVLYVKDKDSWEKDTEEKDKVKTAIKYIAAKNLKQINDWKEENPEADDYDSKKHMDYHNIIIHSTGGATNEEDDSNYKKIIRNVAKEVVIDKT